MSETSNCPDYTPARAARYIPGCAYDAVVASRDRLAERVADLEAENRRLAIRVTHADLWGIQQIERCREIAYAHSVEGAEGFAPAAICKVLAERLESLSTGQTPTSPASTSTEAEPIVTKTER